MSSTGLVGRAIRGAAGLGRTRILALTTAAAFAGIATAWGFELIGGYVPCALCLQQRIPYYIGIPVFMAAELASRFGVATVSKFFAFLGGLIFLIGAGIAVYHSGVEWHFWAGPTDCGGRLPSMDSAKDFLAQLKNTRVVSCTEAAGRFLGLSFAGWNALLASAVAALGFILSTGLVDRISSGSRKA